MSSFYSEPTVNPAPGFVALDDAKALRAAMKGFGTDEAAIITILTKRSNSQRQDIISAFKHEFGRDLIKDLKSELGGKFETLILALMETPWVYLAHELQRAMAGVGTNESVLTTVLCTHTNQDLQNIITAYQQEYGKSLEAAVQSEVSGDYMRLLTLLLSNARDERTVDPHKAREMAEKLFAAGEGKLGTDEETFVVLLSHASFGQLRLVSEEYRKVSKSGKTLEQVVNSEFSGDLKTAILAILKCADNRSRFFAELLEGAMKGFGTRDSDLIRIIVSRCELDLGTIKKEYRTLYNKTLYSAIQSETSGDYKAGLLSLIGEP